MTSTEQSVFSVNFLSNVRAWFEMRADIFVVARYSAMAGAREYFWLKNYDTFQQLLNYWPPQTAVTVFRGDQFPLRGIVTQAFIQRVLDTLPDKTEAMVAQGAEAPDKNLYVWACDTHEEIKEVLQQLLGEHASVGLYASWWEEDNEAMVTALTPLSDGTLKRGIY